MYFVDSSATAENSTCNFSAVKQPAQLQYQKKHFYCRLMYTSESIKQWFIWYGRQRVD